MFNIPLPATGSRNPSPQRFSMGLGGLLGSFVKDIGQSIEHISNATTNYAVRNMVNASLAPYLFFKDNALVVREGGDDIELRDAGLTKTVLEMVPLRAFKGHVSHLHVRNLVSGYAMVEQHKAAGPVHVDITARMVHLCVALKFRLEVLGKLLLWLPGLAAWLLEHFVFTHIFDAWYLDVKPNGVLLLEMGRFNRRQTRWMQGMAEVAIDSAYISHAEVQVKPLANSPGCLQFTLSTVKFDINPTKAYVETFDAHLQDRHPERVAAHSRRTLTVYTGLAALAVVALILAVLLLRGLLLAGGVVWSYALQTLLEPSEGW